MSKVFQVKISDDLLEQYQSIASMQGITIDEFILRALSAYRVLAPLATGDNQLAVMRRGTDEVLKLLDWN